MDNNNKKHLSEDNRKGKVPIVEAQQDSHVFFTDLPNEVIFHILIYLDYYSLIQFFATSTHMRDLGKSNYFFKPLTEKYFPAKLKAIEEAQQNVSSSSNDEPLTINYNEVFKESIDDFFKQLDSNNPAIIYQLFTSASEALKRDKSIMMVAINKHPVSYLKMSATLHNDVANSCKLIPCTN